MTRTRTTHQWRLRAIKIRECDEHSLRGDGRDGRAGEAYERVGELPIVRAANLRWLADPRVLRFGAP
jgi:hypothetical protein